jgi:predicted ATPase
VPYEPQHLHRSHRIGSDPDPLIAQTGEMVARHIEEALTQLDNALNIVAHTGERWFAVELNRLKGQVFLRQGHFEEAEELYRKTLSIAREQEAKLWELRAAASLARLRHDQGRRSEAGDPLAPVYGWFTEGFDAPDLNTQRRCWRNWSEFGRRVEALAKRELSET